jgi:hypothetical protein
MRKLSQDGVPTIVDKFSKNQKTQDIKKTLIVFFFFPIFPLSFSSSYFIFPFPSPSSIFLLSSFFSSSFDS